MDVYKTGMLWVSLNNVQKHTLSRLYSAYTYVHPNDDTQTFCTLVHLNDRIGVPAGCMDKAYSVLGKNINIIDNTCHNPVDSKILLTGLTLRDYQEQALKDTLDYFNEGGTSFNLAGSPGSGKSVMIAGILSALQTKTLIIAHLSMLTTQIADELRSATNADVRILDANNQELGDVNIATSQFISKRPELWYKIKKEIGLIVVDEAETIASETTLRILQRAHAKYRIAVTATFTRSVDGRTPALTDMIGSKVITLVNDKLLKPSIVLVSCNEEFKAPLNKNLYKRALIKFYKNNLSIDDKIVKIAKASIAKERQVLIACDLTEMQDRYASRLEREGIKCGIMNGTTPKKERDATLEKYNNGEIQALLGFGVLNAGLSIPRISTIIRVSTPSNVEKIEQLIGRSLRMYEGKDGAWFFDLVFQGFRSQLIKRRAMYYRKGDSDGWKLSSISWDKLEKQLSSQT